MSAEGPSRRMVAIGGSITLALGLAALGLTAPRFFGPRKTPYDDVLDQLKDRSSAITVGRAAAPLRDVKSVADGLRKSLAQGGLQNRMTSEIAANDLAEVKGWVMPTTLVTLCALAATEG